MIWLIYSLFSWIDTIIYELASSLFRIIFDLAATQFFNDKQIQPIVTRVYIVVGVLMLFKLVISAVQYLINPDSFDDKDKGLGGILKKTAISMALIAVVPTIFQFLIAVQGPIIKTLPSVILGSSASETVDDKTIGFDLSFQILSTFVRPREGKDGSVSDLAGKTQGEIHDFQSFSQNVTRGCPTFAIATIFGGGGSMENCVYDYKIIISTICGAFLCYMLLTMVLDISIRTIKFGIIEMLAPIPISSYIISKDNLNKFVKTASSVYFDLFIRMGIIYFIIFAINAIIETGVLGFGVFSGAADTGNWWRNIVVNVALIFGLLAFASKAPKFLSELLGLPDVGSGDLADMFKPVWQRAGGGFGSLVNPFANAIGNARQAWGTNENMGSKLRRGINAARRGIAGFGKGALDSVEGVMAGDDWHKMHNRLNASKQRSLERAKTQQNRIENRKQYASRLESIRNQIASLRKRFGNDEKIIEEANRRYDAEQQKLRTLGDEIRVGIDNGTLTGDALSEKLHQYQELSTALSNKDTWIRSTKAEIAAEVKQQEKIDDINEKIAKVNQKISSATTTEDRIAAEIERDELEQQLENITHEKAINQNNANINDANSEIATVTSDITNSNSRIASLTANKKRREEEAQREINRINSKLNDNEIEGDERVELHRQLRAIMSTRDSELATIDTQISQENAKVESLNQRKTAAENVIATAQEKLSQIEKEKAEYKQKIVSECTSILDQIDGLAIQQQNVEDEKALVEKALKQSGWRSSVDSYFGGIPVSGKGYTDLASLLGQTRSAIYTGEAMTKMRQNADILVDVNGEPIKFSTKFGNKEYSYEMMVKIKNMLERSEIDDKKLRDDYGFNNSAIFGSAFEDIEKQAAAAYITANVATIDSSVKSKYYLKRPEDVNSAVIEVWNTFVGELAKSGVPAEEIGKLIDDFKKDPGKFMSKASSKKDLYSSAGKNIIDVQKPSDGNK